MLRPSAKWLGFAAGLFALTLIQPLETAGQEAKPVPKVVERAVRAVPIQAAVDDAAFKQWEQRFAPQARQAQRMELHFMRLVTDPTRQQYGKVAADSEPAMKEAIRKWVEAMVGRGGVNQSDPRLLITDAIAKSIAANLSPEQAARYQKEIDLRTVARKRLVVMNLVAMTDRVLVLRPDQRVKLAEILAENWNESWNQTQLLTMGGQYFPQMPEVMINAMLTDAQRTVWRGIQKTTVHFGVNFGFQQGIEIEDEVWDDDPPRKKPARKADEATPKEPVPPKAAEKP